MCATVSKQVVIGYLQLLLKGAHLESTTEEQLRKKLSTHFQQDVEAYEHDIQAEVEKFVVMSATDGCKPSGKRGRENQDPGADTAKRPRADVDVVERIEFGLCEDGVTRCVITEFSGAVYVDIRTCVKQGSRMVPTRKGISLTIPEWRMLETALPSLCEAIEEQDLSHTVALGWNRRVTIVQHRDQAVAANIREYSGPKARPQATNTGIVLKAACVKVLCESADAITAALLRRPDDSSATAAAQDGARAQPPAAPPAPTPPAASANPAGGPQQHSHTRAQMPPPRPRPPPPPQTWHVPRPPSAAPPPLAPPPPPPPPPAPAPDGAAAPPAPPDHHPGNSTGCEVPTVPCKFGGRLWRLSGSRARNTPLAGTCVFKGQTFVTVREHYEKGGLWCPCKRGVNLTLEQFHTLCMHQQAISSAVAAQDTALRFALSATRCVLLGFHKDVLYVNFRDHNEDHPLTDPCRGRGIGLTVPEWRGLAALLPMIHASL